MNFEFFRRRLEHPLNEYLLIDPTGKGNPRNAVIYCLKDRSVTLDESNDADAFAQWMHSQGVPVVESAPDGSPIQRPCEPEEDILPEFEDTNEP